MTDAPDIRPLPLPTPTSFRYEERDKVGIVTLARPDRFNALTFEVYRELTDFFAVIERRALAPGGARALVLQGEGRRSAAAATSRTSSVTCSRAMPRGSCRSRA
jgi:hypothetical protein